MGRQVSEAERLGRRCSNCGDQGKVLAKGLCGPCYYYVKNHGKPRPPEVSSLRQQLPLRPCGNCGRPAKPLTRGLCRQCYARWLVSGQTERPSRAVATPPIPPAPEDLFFASLEQGPPRRWPGREVVGPPGRRHGEAQRLLSRAPLSERERFIVEQTYGLDGGGRRAMGAVAAAMGISRERVRQLQHEAMGKLRRAHADAGNPDVSREEPAGRREVDAALEALAGALRAERELASAPPRSEADARTWEAGMIRGLRLGKQAAYDVALSYIDDVRAGKDLGRS